MKSKLIAGLMVTLFLVNLLIMVGSVSAQITGDINDDGKVNICDGVIIAVAFGSRPSDSNWNPDADIAPLGAPDNFISLQDVVLWAIHFGETV